MILDKQTCLIVFGLFLSGCVSANSAGQAPVSGNEISLDTNLIQSGEPTIDQTLPVIGQPRSLLAENETTDLLKENLETKEFELDSFHPVQRKMP